MEFKPGNRNAAKLTQPELAEGQVYVFTISR